MDTETYKDYTIKLMREDEAESPLDWASPEERGAWFVMKHRGYNLPTEVNVDFDDYDGWAELAEANCLFNGERKPYKFVQWYEHGGITVSLRDTPTTTDRWDAGIVGLIYGDSNGAIQSNFEDWKAYIEGDIWYANIIDSDGDHVDSIGMVIGRDNVMEEVKYILDRYVPPHKVAKKAQELHS